MAEISLPETVSTTALAGLLGVSPRQVRNRMDAAGVKSAVRGEWPLGASIRALLAAADRKGEPNPLATARARSINAQARQRELALARDEGRLIDREVFSHAFDQVMGAIIEQLDGMPARITRDITLRRRIEGEIRDARLRAVASIQKAAERLAAGDDFADDEAA